MYGHALDLLNWKRRLPQVPLPPSQRRFARIHIVSRNIFHCQIFFHLRSYLCSFRLCGRASAEAMKVHSADTDLPPDKSHGYLRKLVEAFLVNKANSADYSEAWKAKFSRTPTWCDADMSIQQINRGLATGNRVALYARSFFQKGLFKIGCFVQRWAWTTIIISLILYTLCCGGLRNVIIETDIVKLWVSQGGRLNEELNFLSRVQHESQRVHKREAPIQPVNGGNHSRPPPRLPHARRGPELPKENGLGGGFQVVIQTPTQDGENALTRDGLLKHVDLMQEISQYTVQLHGENWTLSDICFKPPGPGFTDGPLAKLMSTLLDKIIPCIWITPIDCFWEGSKPLGPNPPLVLGEEISAFVASLPKGNITWKNLDPTAVMSEVGALFDLGPIGNFFERAGIGSAYLDRPCIEPLDPECPPQAPNHFDRCAALTKFYDWNNGLPMSDKVILKEKELPKEGNTPDIAESFLSDFIGIGKRKKRQADQSGQGATTSGSKNETKKSDDYYAYQDENDYDTSNITEKKKEARNIPCLQYGESLLLWMQENRDRWGEFLTEKEFPVYPNYGEVMTGGCKGFGKNIMRWPEDLIIGGVKREGAQLASAEALQSVFLVASPFDVFIRYKEPKPEVKPLLDTASWSPGKAEQVIVAWQRNFTVALYNHKANLEVEGTRVFHPLASTSIADMLEEFSQFNYLIIVLGYGLMIIYAAWTQLRWKGRWLAVNSNVALSFAGVFLVTYSSICGLGLATSMGINFNAATTQIVPFLSLGLGIDDMFLLLHNYDELVHTVHHQEMGILLKETGMSIMVTSINNILAFVSGYVLPIPALRSFCSQTAVLLLFNLLSLMFIFPAFIGLDLRRRRAGKRDLCYCCSPSTAEGIDGPASELGREASERSLPSKVDSSAELTHGFDNNKSTEFVRDDPWYTIGGFLNLYYIPALKMRSVKLVVIVFSIAAFIFGLFGMYSSTLGLELSDVLPENTAPAAFLRAREKYFSFYPMYAVLRGQTIDIPQQQEQIEDYRRAIAKSEFVIKVDGRPSEEYWMSLFRIWLRSLDKSLEKEIAAETIDMSTGNALKGKKPAPEALIAARLACSFGSTFNCTHRLGKIRFVDEKGFIRPDGFYNYLTAWYNVDNMMYYVSQASFFPVPPSWAYSPAPVAVPPAQKLLYSQIPFYLTNLVNTPVIVRMIEGIRGTCEEFTSEGLDNFPQGLAFTFWEQYLSLRINLFFAIVIIAFAVFAVISLLMFNPWAAAMVMVIVVTTTVELGGFMGLVGIKMNPISAVTLITAVGIAVEFTAHVVLSFITSLGTVDERLQSCLEHMFVPVFHGAISTLLGIVMLVFSQFDFVIKYFFVVMSVLVLIGIFNGLCLLPVLLTIIGPESELKPKNGSNRLPPPPPLEGSRSSSLYKEIISRPDEGELRHRSNRGSPLEVEMRNRSAGEEPSPREHNFHDSLSTINEEAEVSRTMRL